LIDQIKFLPTVYRVMILTLLTLTDLTLLTLQQSNIFLSSSTCKRHCTQQMPFWDVVIVLYTVILPYAVTLMASPTGLYARVICCTGEWVCSRGGVGYLCWQQSSHYSMSVS